MAVSRTHTQNKRANSYIPRLGWYKFTGRPGLEHVTLRTIQARAQTP